MAEKSDCFLPELITNRDQSLQCACWAQSDMQPVLKQVQEILRSSQQLPIELEHQSRLLRQTLTNKLSGHQFTCANELTVADFALYPAITSITTPSINLRTFPPLAQRLEQMDSIGFVRRGLTIP
ncbi:MAG: glutathione binding-like protein [Marinobacterium sp.]|nr:glutathione binding-like protein [Marinobacterium sp.]